MDNQSAGIYTGGGSAIGIQAGFDSGGNSFENESSEAHEIYSTQNPINTVDEIPEDDGSRIMEIPGTAHDKLEAMAKMPESVEAGTQDEKNDVSYRDMVPVSEDEDDIVILIGLTNAKKIIMTSPNLKPDEILAIQREEIKKARKEMFKAKKHETKSYKSFNNGQSWIKSDAVRNEDGISWGIYEETEAEISQKTENSLKESDKADLDRNQNEPSIEQKIINLQAEALKYLAKGKSEIGNDKEKEELLRKLKELLEELEKSESSTKMLLIKAVLGVIILLFDVTEKGAKQLEKEVKRAQ